MKNTHKNTKPIGIYNCGLTGLEILNIEHEINDYIIFRDCADNSLHKRMVYYNNDSTYFRYYNKRISLSNCIRVW